MRSTREYVYVFVDFFGWAALRRIACLIVIMLGSMTALLVVSLFCGGILDGVARVGASLLGTAGGLALARLGRWSSAIAAAWIILIAILGMAVFPGAGILVLVVPVGLWLASVNQGDDLAPWVIGGDALVFVVVVLSSVVLLMGEGVGWFLIFTVGAAVASFANCRPGSGVLLLGGVVCLLVVGLEQRGWLGGEALFPLFRRQPAAIPVGSLTMGWLRLGVVGFLAAALPASGILLVYCRKPHPIALALVAMTATHFLLHALQVVGPVYATSLPMTGPAADCFAYACMATLVVIDLRSEFDIPRSGWRRRRRKRRTRRRRR